MHKKQIRVRGGIPNLHDTWDSPEHLEDMSDGGQGAEGTKKGEAISKGRYAEIDETGDANVLELRLQLGQLVVRELQEASQAQEKPRAMRLLLNSHHPSSAHTRRASGSVAGAAAAASNPRGKNFKGDAPEDRTYTSDKQSDTTVTPKATPGTAAATATPSSYVGSPHGLAGEPSPLKVAVLLSNLEAHRSNRLLAAFAQMQLQLQRRNQHQYQYQYRYSAKPSTYNDSSCNRTCHVSDSSCPMLVEFFTGNVVADPVVLEQLGASGSGVRFFPQLFPPLPSPRSENQEQGLTYQQYVDMVERAVADSPLSRFVGAVEFGLGLDALAEEPGWHGLFEVVRYLSSFDAVLTVAQLPADWLRHSGDRNTGDTHSGDNSDDDVQPSSHVLSAQMNLLHVLPELVERYKNSAASLQMENGELLQMRPVEAWDQFAHPLMNFAVFLNAVTPANGSANDKDAEESAFHKASPIFKRIMRTVKSFDAVLVSISKLCYFLFFICTTSGMAGVIYKSANVFVCNNSPPLLPSPSPQPYISSKFYVIRYKSYICVLNCLLIICAYFFICCSLSSSKIWTSFKICLQTRETGAGPLDSTHVSTKSSPMPK